MENGNNRWKVGNKIGNRYEIFKVLGGVGTSGMGIVYVCYDHIRKIPIALKTYQEKFLESICGIIKQLHYLKQEILNRPFLIPTKLLN